MRSYFVFLTMLLVAIPGSVGYAGRGDPTVKELLEQVGIKPQGDQRGQMDIVGFATTAEQMDEVVAQCRALANSRLRELS